MTAEVSHTVHYSWMERALCLKHDPELFFPDKGKAPKEAKEICAACPVQTECLEYGMQNTSTRGVYGGLSEYERRRLRRKNLKIETEVFSNDD
jgi:WhiB family redox-sensing transcriptional regulator